MGTAVGGCGSAETRCRSGWTEVRGARAVEAHGDIGNGGEGGLVV
jgi:hypothetical protein